MQRPYGKFVQGPKGVQSFELFPSDKYDTGGVWRYTLNVFDYRAGESDGTWSASKIELEADGICTIWRSQTHAPESEGKDERVKKRFGKFKETSYTTSAAGSTTKKTTTKTTVDHELQYAEMSISGKRRSGYSFAEGKNGGDEIIINKITPIVRTREWVGCIVWLKLAKVNW